MNAVAGGGTLISFPMLVLAGLPMVTANITNTLAIWPGTLTSAWAYRHELRSEGRLARSLAVPAVLGGLIGALLLLWLPEQVFMTLVPWLLLFACGLLGAQGPLRRLLQRQTQGPSFWAMAAVQLLISIYGGYFGAAAGVLMLAAMGVLLPIPSQHQNALKVWMALWINGAASVVFLVGAARSAESLLNLNVLAVMLLSSALGGWLGAGIARRLPPAGLRLAAVLIGLLAAMKFAFQSA